MFIQAALTGCKRRVTGAMVVLLMAGTFAGAVHGENRDDSIFSFRGFGTLGAVYSDQDQADFAGDFTHPDGPGYSDSWAMSVDSKLGLQLDARFTDKMSAVLQVVTRYDRHGDYSPDIEWANISYKPTPALTVRVGRIVTPTFMESETRLVGYTYPWIRPPLELYGLNPITNKDGIDFRYQFPVGEAYNALQLSYGKTFRNLPGDIEADVHHTLDMQYVLEYGATRFRVGYMTMDLDITSPDLDALFDGFARFGNAVPGPSGERALVNESRFRADDTRYEIFSLGLDHQPGSWLFRAEWAHADTHRPSFLSDVTAWYLTVGHRFGAFTPFITASEVSADKTRAANIPGQGLPPELADTAAMLNTGLDEIVGAFAFDQETYTAGVRWDVFANIAVKMQYQHLRTRSGSPGRLINVQPGFEAGDKANLFSLAVDFVF